MNETMGNDTEEESLKISDILRFGGIGAACKILGWACILEELYVETTKNIQFDINS